MIAIFAFIVAHIPAILALGGTAIGLIGVFFGKSVAKSAKQNAAVATANANATVAQVQKSAADDNAAASQKVTEIQQNQVQAAAAVAKVPDSDLDAQSKKLGGEK